MNRLRGILAAGAVLAALLPAAGCAQPARRAADADVVGVWQDPAGGTVHLRADHTFTATGVPVARPGDDGRRGPLTTRGTWSLDRPSTDLDHQEVHLSAPRTSPPPLQVEGSPEKIRLYVAAGAEQVERIYYARTPAAAATGSAATPG